MNSATPQHAMTASSILSDRGAVFVDWVETARHEPRKKRAAFQLRTRARRLEASMRALRPMLRKRDARATLKTVRSLRRVAGAARDADVIGKRFRKRLENTFEPAGCAALGYLIARMGAERDLATVALEQVSERTARDVESLSDRLLDAVKHGDSPEKLRAVAADSLRDEALLFSHASEQDLTDLDLLHDLRKQGKRLRYTVEVFAPLLPAPFASEILTRMKDFQQRLGSINDQHVQLLTITRAEERRDCAPVARALVALRDEFERTLDREHASFVRWWWDLGAAQQLLGCAHELTVVRSEAAVA